MSSNPRACFVATGPDGTLIDSIETEVQDGQLMTIDPATGRLAIGGSSGVALVDPATKEVEALPQALFVSNLAFARNGELLAVRPGRHGEALGR